MGTVIKRPLIIAAAFVALATVAGRADASEVLKLNVPFSFVVHGTTMPAGHYLLERDDKDPSIILIHGDKENSHTGVFVLTNNASGHDPAGNKPAVTFNRYENQYQLSGVWESAGEGKTVVGR
jgi:hypothetical protein